MWPRKILAVALPVAVFVLAACGGSDTTIERTTTVEAPQPEREPISPATPSGEPPNVEGLPLPAAKQELERAGYRTAAKNTDTTFGIIDPSNYTICEQGKPRGDLVVVLAQKYGC